MKKLLISLLFTIVILQSLSSSVVGLPQSGDVAQQLMDLEQRLAKSILNSDFETYSAILAPEWTTIDLTGHILTKSQLLQEFAAKDRLIEEAKIDEMKVKDFGDVAVVTGHSTFKGKYKGQPVTVVLRFTDVFVKRDDRWLVVASQGKQVRD
ncbi:MAG TPA: nuclear transport factor 2 family protein [Pyrinomonadaceae bacterium]|jgi:ketosteroid isomerase-like protein|nr:nuclear transport factor 2 family protein [Pyrinomonadaceae bacterium]